MSISALTSYVNTNNKLNPPPGLAKGPDKETGKPDKSGEAEIARPPLDEVLSPKQFQRLETLREQKQDISSQLSAFEEQFSEMEGGFGDNLKADIRNIVDMGKGLFRAVRQMQSAQSEISSMLGSAAKSGADGVIEGKGQDAFDAQSLTSDLDTSKRLKSLLSRVYDAYQNTKSAAQDVHDQETANSSPMKLANKFGQRMLNWTNNLVSDVQTAAASGGSISILA